MLETIFGRIRTQFTVPRLKADYGFEQCPGAGRFHFLFARSTRGKDEGAGVAGRVTSGAGIPHIIAQIIARR